MQTLTKLLSSPARTAVLEILTKVKSPLHLRAIAELSGFTPRAIQQCLKKLVAENILLSERKSNKIFFSINDKEDQARLLSEVFATSASFQRSEVFPHYKRRIDVALELNDYAFTMNKRQKPSVSAETLLKSAIEFLSEKKIRFVLSGELAASVHRSQISTFHNISFIIETNSISKFKRNLPVLQKKLFRNFEIERARSSIRFLPKKYVFSADVNFIWNESRITPREIHATLWDHDVVIDSPERILLSFAKQFLNDPEKLLLTDFMQSIFEAKENLDLAFLVHEMQKQKLPFHWAVLAYAPRVIRDTSRKISRLYGPYPHLQRRF